MSVSQGNGDFAMGRHNCIYLAAQQKLTLAPAQARTASAHVGRVGLLAVALGIGAAIAGGTAAASADTTSSNAPADRAEQSSTTEQSSENDPGPAAATALTGVRGTADDETPGDDASPTDDAEEVEAEADEAETAAPISAATKSRSARAGNRDDAVNTVTVDAAPTASITSTVDAPVPSPDDQVPTEYGDIGKWMLQWNGEIADYGGVPHQGKTVLETVNVIIVDPTSKSSLTATWRLNAAMRRAGFPPRLIHSTGFRGLIDDRRYRQQPSGLLVGYSDDFFLVRNNHGRIFGPDPVETADGYVWSGSFTTEDLAFVNGLPRHVYVSSNEARDALAADLVASGRGQLGGVVALDNSHNTETITTGDHDGNAVVIVLIAPYAVARGLRVGGAASNTRSCAVAGDWFAYSERSSCEAVAITASRGTR